MLLEALRYADAECHLAHLLFTLAKHSLDLTFVGTKKNLYISGNVMRFVFTSRIWWLINCVDGDTKTLQIVVCVSEELALDKIWIISASSLMSDEHELISDS